MKSVHIPVLSTVTLSVTAPASGERVLDCTLGLGGHASLFLEATSPDGTLTGVDADTSNLVRAKERLSSSSKRTYFVHANFSEIPECLPKDGRTFDIVFADLGLSSPHLDDEARGFSFHGTSPLDMRYDVTKGMTAADILMTSSKDELTHIFQNYGELPKTHRFVAAIMEARKTMKIATAEDLKRIAEPLYKRALRDMLPLIFQALRIAVNEELAALEHLLAAAPKLLAPAGRFAVISYHSLEDRLVKRAFRSLVSAPKDQVTGRDLHPPQFESLTKKALIPDESERTENPRSRSAKLRAVRKLPSSPSAHR